MTLIGCTADADQTQGGCKFLASPYTNANSQFAGARPQNHKFHISTRIMRQRLGWQVRGHYPRSTCKRVCACEAGMICHHQTARNRHQDSPERPSLPARICRSISASTSALMANHAARFASLAFLRASDRAERTGGPDSDRVAHASFLAALRLALVSLSSRSAFSESHAAKARSCSARAAFHRTRRAALFGPVMGPSIAFTKPISDNSDNSTRAR